MILVIAHLDEEPDLEFLSIYIDGRYNENPGVFMVKMGYMEVNFFKNGKVSVRMVDTEAECIHFIHSILSMAYHKALIAGKL